MVTIRHYITEEFDAARQDILWKRTTIIGGSKIRFSGSRAIVVIPTGVEKTRNAKPLMGMIVGVMALLLVILRRPKNQIEKRFAK